MFPTAHDLSLQFYLFHITTNFKLSLPFLRLYSDYICRHPYMPPKKNLAKVWEILDFT